MVFSLPLLLAIVALLAAQFVFARLRVLAQPLRLRMAETGEELLASPRLTPAQRKQVNFLLDRAFGMRLEIIFGCLICVFAVPWVILGLARGGNGETMDAEDRAKLLSLQATHRVVMLLNNPVLTVLLYAEMFVLVAVFGLLVVLIKNALPQPPRLEWLLERISKFESPRAPNFSMLFGH